MSALVASETLLLCLLALLLVGLLRSHAAILQRLSSIEGRSESEPEERATVLEGIDIAGESVDRRPITVGVRHAGGKILLAFLTTGCEPCHDFWRALGDVRSRSGLLRHAQIAIVTKGRDEESTTRIRRLGTKRVPVVLSTTAWKAYRVPGSPYFVYIDGEDGRVVGQGTASTWEQMIALIEDSVADVRLSDMDGNQPPSWQSSRVNAILTSAGIGPDHPSLYDTRLSVDELEESER